MRKNIILLGLLATTSLAFAQTGKVGVNTSNPEATLDIKPSAANAVTSATTNEGILIPRVSRDRLKSIATANLKESTLVYVDNISGTINPVTSNVTSKGFYYYSTTDSKWVKIAEGTTQEQDLRLVGNDHHITQDGGKGGNGTSAGNGRNNLAIGKNTLFSITGGSNNIAMGEGALYTNTVGPQNIALGNNALYSNQWGAWNIAVGIEALYSNQGGMANVAIGHNALRNGTGGVGNIAIGWDAMMTGGNGIAIGSQALKNSQTGSSNVAIGSGALRENTTGRDNVALGIGALVNNTTASNNIAVGTGALTTNTTGASNVAVGASALRHNTTGNNNIGVGSETLYLNTTGVSNVAIGPGSLYNNTTGDNNISLGTNTLRTNTTGRDNIAMGTAALFANTTGANNIAIGSNGLRFNTTGSNNISFGTNTLRLNTTGDRNIAIGDGTLSGNTLGAYNIGLGISVLNSNTTGKSNIGLGTNSLSANISGDSNVGIGNSALFSNVTGTYNIAIGHYPLNKATASHHNIALGYNTMENNTYGNYNIALGASALSSNTTGQHNNAQGVNALKNNVRGNANIAFGHGAGEWIKSDYNVHIGNASFPAINTAELENVIVIGNGINVAELTPSTGRDNSIILGYKNGHNRSPNVGLGTYKPDTKLHIVANGPAIKIQDTNQGAGRVLTSDANGVGTWKDLELFKGAPAVGRFTWNAGVRLGNSRWNKIATVVVKPGTNMVFVKLHILSSQVPHPTKAYTRVYVGMKDVGANNGYTNEKPIYTMFHPYLEHDYEFVGNFIYNNNTNSYQTLYLNLQSDVPNIIRSAFEYNTSASQVYGTTWYENWFYSVPVN